MANFLQGLREQLHGTAYPLKLETQARLINAKPNLNSMFKIIFEFHNRFLYNK